MNKDQLKQFIRDTLRRYADNPILYTVDGVADMIDHRVDLMIDELYCIAQGCTCRRGDGCNCPILSEFDR
jgi:hypothetical protein